MELLTTQETADRLKVPIGTLRYWIQLGTAPPSSRIGKRRMFRSVDVEAWVARHFEEGHR